MLLQKILLALFAVVCLNSAITATNDGTDAGAKNAATRPELIAKSEQMYELNAGDVSGYTSSAGGGLLSKPYRFEEIVTQSDSGRVIAFYAPVSINAVSYRHDLDAGKKAQHILQELLPLNIF